MNILLKKLNFIKKKKILYSGIIFLLFLFAGFFYISINKALALNLEVKYPPVGGYSPNTDTNLTMPRFVLYLFNVGTFIGFFGIFISLLVAGVMYFLAPVFPSLQADAKERISGSISGLLILTLSYLIITTINPQLSFLTLSSLPPNPPPTAIPPDPGIYFYKDPSCGDKGVKPSPTSLPDLGDLKNQIHSVGIIQDKQKGDYYITLLYNNPGFWGKCQYITSTDPNSIKECKPVDPFASSASIYKYDFHPLDNNPPFDGGVYFFRKSCFINSGNNYSTSDLVKYCKQSSGGYYYIPSQRITAPSIFALNQLKFIDVPKDEQDCTEYDKNGKCCTKSSATLKCNGDGRTPQTLGGENISSFIINGNYLVLLVYFNAHTDTATSWSSCQEFPTINDTNKIGPQQVKWEAIRNSGGIVPNYAIIFPIQK